MTEATVDELRARIKMIRALGFEATVAALEAIFKEDLQEVPNDGGKNR